MKEDKKKTTKNKSHDNDKSIITFGKETIDISKISDEELTKLYDKMEKKIVNLASKIISLNEKNAILSSDEISKMLQLLQWYYILLKACTFWQISAKMVGPRRRNGKY